MIVDIFGRVQHYNVLCVVSQPNYQIYKLFAPQVGCQEITILQYRYDEETQQVDFFLHNYQMDENTSLFNQTDNKAVQNTFTGSEYNHETREIVFYYDDVKFDHQNERSEHLLNMVVYKKVEKEVAYVFLLRHVGCHQTIALNLSKLEFQRINKPNQKLTYNDDNFCLPAIIFQRNQLKFVYRSDSIYKFSLLMQDRSSFSYLVSTVKADSHEKKHKMLEKDHYTTASYTSYTPSQYMFRLNLQNLRNKSRLIKMFGEQFQNSVHMTIITDDDKAQNPSYILTQSRFIPPSNILSILALGTKDIDKARIINKTIIKLVITLMKQSNFQIFALQDLSIRSGYNEDVQILVDQAAITGMHLLMNDEEISQHQFFEIYQILQTKSLQQHNLKTIFSFQLKVRAIAKVLLSLVFQRKFSLKNILSFLNNISKNTNGSLSKLQCQRLLDQRSKYFRQVFDSLQFTDMISKIQMQNGVNYKQFLNKVFLQESDISWSQLIRLIVPKKTIHSRKQNLNPQLVPYIELMKFLQNKHQFDLQFVQNLHLLGLYDEPKPLLIALMSQYTSFAEQAIRYQNLNQLLYCPNQLDFSVRNELFQFFSKLFGQILPQHITYYLQQESECRKQSLKVEISCQQPKFQYSSVPTCKNKPSYSLFPCGSYENQSKQQSQKLNDINPHRQFSQIQLGLSFQRICYNFGTLEMKFRKRTFCTQNYYTAAIRKTRRKYY